MMNLLLLLIEANKIDTNLGQAAWLGLVCYLLDAFEIVLEVAGIKGKKNDFSTIAAKLLTASWIAVRVRLYKRHFFEAAFDYASKLGPNRTNKPVAKVDVVDKVSIYVLPAWYSKTLHILSAPAPAPDHRFLSVRNTCFHLDRYSQHKERKCFIFGICVRWCWYAGFDSSPARLG